MRDRVLSDRALGLYGDLTLLAIPELVLHPVLVGLIVEQVPLPLLLLFCLIPDDNEADLTRLDCRNPLLLDCFSLLDNESRLGCFTRLY